MRDTLAFQTVEPATPATGPSYNLSCVRALDVRLAVPGGPVFLQPAGLALGPETVLVMQSVELVTDCATVLAYQGQLCDTLALAGTVQLLPGRLEVSRWSDARTLVADTNVTCTPDQPGAAPPPAPCNLISVSDADELGSGFSSYQQALNAPITLVLAANVTLPDPPLTSGLPEPVVNITNNVTIVSSRHLSTMAVLDFNLRVDYFNIGPGAFVMLHDLVGVNLATNFLPMDHPYKHMELLSKRVWAFRRTKRVLFLHNVTLVLPVDELQYTKYWVTFLLSPVPEARADAAWLKVANSDMQVSNVTDHAFYYDFYILSSFTYTNVCVTDELPGYSHLLQPETALRQLQDGAAPLTAVTTVINATDLLVGLGPNATVPDRQGRRFVLLRQNITLPDGAGWPAAGMAVPPGNVVLGRGPGEGAKRLSFGLAPGAQLSVPLGTSVLTLQQLVLSGLPPAASTYQATSPIEVLAAALWPVGGGTGARLLLNNVTLLVSQQELDLLLMALVPGIEAAVAAGNYTSGNAAVGQQVQAPPQQPQVPDPLLVAAVRSFFAASSDAPLQVADHGPGHLLLAQGATARYSLTNVLIRAPDPSYGEVAGPSLTALGVPYGPPAGTGGNGGGGGGGLAPWAIGVIVGVVSAVLLCALAVAAVLLHRRRSRGEPRTALLSKHAFCGCWRSKPGSASVLPPPAGSSSLVPTPVASELRAAATLTPGLHVLQQPPAAGQYAAVSLVKPCASVASGAPTSASCLSGATDPRVIPGTEAISNRSMPVAAAHQQPPGVTSSAADSFDCPPDSGYGLPPTGMAPSRKQALTLPSGSGASAQSQAPASSNASTQPYNVVHSAINALGRDLQDSQLQAHELLGKGAYGTVYRGTWRGLQVAIKSMVFGGDSAVGSGISQQRPLLEAAISSNLAHPNIVTTYAYELKELPHEFAAVSPELARQGGGWRLCLIQEYCDGGPLKRLVDDGHFASPASEAPDACSIMPKLAIGPQQRCKPQAAALQPQPELEEEAKPEPEPEPAATASAAATGMQATQEEQVQQPQAVVAVMAAPGDLSHPHEQHQQESSGVASPPPASEAGARDSSSGSGTPVAGSGNTAPLAAAQAPALLHVGGGSPACLLLLGERGRQPARSAAPAGLEAAAGGAPHGPAPGSGSAAKWAEGAPQLLPAAEVVPPASAQEAICRYVAAALMSARGLAHIHAKNIIHGDLNSANVLLSMVPEPGERVAAGPGSAAGAPAPSQLGYVCKVADFGLSVRVQEDQSHLSNLFQGTPYYIAPEVVMSGRVSKAADVYALGIMMWELQHGERAPWRRGRRLPTFPLLNTGQLAFRSDCPHAYAALARRCFHGAHDLRPPVEEVVAALLALFAQVANT